MMWHEQTAPRAGSFESGKSAGMKTASTFLSPKHRIPHTLAEPRKGGGRWMPAKHRQRPVSSQSEAGIHRLQLNKKPHAKTEEKAEDRRARRLTTP